MIFRRGYFYSEDRTNSIFQLGILFICFQKVIEKGFEYIMNILNNKNFPLPAQRKNFNTQGIYSVCCRHQYIAIQQGMVS